MACYAAATSSGCLEAALPACASRDPRVGFAVQSCGTLRTAVCGTGRLGRAGGLHVVAVEVDTLQLRAAPLLLLLVMLLMRMLCATGGGDEQRNRQGAPHGARHGAFCFSHAAPRGRPRPRPRWGNLPTRGNLPIADDAAAHDLRTHPATRRQAPPLRLGKSSGRAW